MVDAPYVQTFHGAEATPPLFFYVMPAISELAPAQEPEHEDDPLSVVLEPVLAGLGFELVALEWGGSPAGRQVLRVYIDSAEGVSVDDCVRMSPVVGNSLDAWAANCPPNRATGLAARQLAAPYVLEVSSPGLERPLVRRAHFARFEGRRVKVQLHRPLAEGDAQRIFHGTIRSTSADPNAPDDERRGTVVLSPIEGGDERCLSIDQIRRANLVYEG